MYIQIRFCITHIAKQNSRSYPRNLMANNYCKYFVVVHHVYKYI